MAARIQAKVLFNYVQLSKTDKLWAEAMHWACEALNPSACSANPDSKSPPSRFPPPQPPLPIEVAEEGGEESDGDAEAKVAAWGERYSSRSLAA